MSELTPELLLHGYSIGIFPMAEHRDDPEIFWGDPRPRRSDAAERVSSVPVTGKGDASLAVSRQRG